MLELEDRHLLPQAYLEGFARTLAISNQGSVAFVAGKTYLQAPWFSTPLNFLIRNTAAMLAMILLAAFGIAITFRQHRRKRLFLLVPAAIYLAVCLHASINVSVRYLLPMFPFLLIAVADGCVELARRVRWVSYALPCLLVLHAASSLHAYPNYLSYANDLWGGPARAYKYEPWLDWGQAYPQAKDYLDRHPTENCWFITGWQWDPGFYNVPCRTFGNYLPHEIPPHVHGTIIVSSTLLTDVRLAEGELAAAFKNATPKDHIGGSALLVYEGDFDTSLDAATGERNLAMHASSDGQLSAALEHAKRAVELAPASALAHGNLCCLAGAYPTGFSAEGMLHRTRPAPARSTSGRASSEILPGLTCAHPYGAQKRLQEGLRTRARDCANRGRLAPVTVKCRTILVHGLVEPMPSKCFWAWGAQVTIVTRHDWAGAAARLGKMSPTRRISAPTAFSFSSMFS